MNIVHNIVVIAIFAFVVNVPAYVAGWDSEELELFDLVEEVNTNFYTLLGVLPTSDAKTIRHAFKNLSLKLHPDKNDAPDAEIKFRQLVAVHEILRDPARRKRYDEVLENGLPDWRHPVYYYRRVRKMGLSEMLIILFTIVTVAQYIVAWAAYLEKKYIVEEYVTAERKRLQKKQKKGKLEGDMPNMTIQIPKPSIFNTLPFQIPKLVWTVMTCIPISIKLFFSYCTQKQKVESFETFDKSQELEQEFNVKGHRRRRNFVIPKISDENKSNGNCLLDSNDSSCGDELDKKPLYGGLWTDDDLTELIKLVNKYPPGTIKRWEKIAEIMNRTVPEVTYMAKKVKENMTIKSDPIEDILEKPKKIKTKGGKLNNSENGPNVTKPKDWNQIQQKALEEALLKFPKNLDERWEKIAKSVPGKTKEDCILRYKELHDMVKKKKEPCL